MGRFKLNVAGQTIEFIGGDLAGTYANFRIDSVISDGALVKAKVGSPAPEIEWILNGKQQKLSELKGKPVLIDFFELSCRHCYKALPQINAYTQENKTLQVLVVSSDKPAHHYFKSKELPWMTAFVNPMIRNVYGIDGWPQYALVDARGILIAKFSNFDAAKVDSLLKR